ncbi:MAG: VOC family protein [Pirellulales bacterium]|nr:VOC family protein [Pirellulales bacterium]
MAGTADRVGVIAGLFETHIGVTDLARSTAFYCELLGLQVGLRDAARRVNFLWVGPPGEAMLGLWERPAVEVHRQHFAFRAALETVRDRAVPWLHERGLACRNFLRDGTERPMVFGWMPALSIYFDDPDGHELELIAMLPDPPRDDVGVVSWDDWQRLNGRVAAQQ